MRHPRASTGLLLLALLLTAALADAQGLALYVSRVVVAAPGDLKLGDLVRTSLDVPTRGREALARSIAALGDRPMYIPVAIYLSDLEAAFGSDAIIVGSRTLVVPKGTPMEQETYTLDRLVDFLQAQGMLADDRQELILSQNSVVGAALIEGTPTFQVHKAGRDQTEVTFLLAGAAGSSVTGRISLAALGGGSAIDVKPGSMVKVIFHKGPITIEMPGKAMGSASTGDSISVYVADSQKSFTGMLSAGKAVNVELP
jgi:hypothetical protein